MLTHSSSVPSEFVRYRDLLPLSAEQPLIFLDIETMGLSHRRDPIILLGLMVLDSNEGSLFQFFSQHPQEERMMLKAMIDCLPAKGPIFTYNGRSFDIPYINHRMASHGFDYRIPTPRGADLMHWAKSAFPSLPRHTLKTVELHLGIHRKDTLSGADCVLQYQEYLENQNPRLADDICRHNFEDILHLAPLLQLYRLLPDHSPHRTLPMSLFAREHLFWIEFPICRKDALTFKGFTDTAGGGNAVCYRGSATVEILHGELSVKLPVIAFNYPVPGSLYIDCDRIPGYHLHPFNDLSTKEKMQLLVREGTQYHSTALTDALEILLALT